MGLLKRIFEPSQLVLRKWDWWLLGASVVGLALYVVLSRAAVSQEVVKGDIAHRVFIMSDGGVFLMVAVLVASFSAFAYELIKIASVGELEGLH